MRIRILSDLHLEHNRPDSIPHCPADLVILAGDIANGRAGIDWAAVNFDCPVVYVPGNHEYYETTLHHADAQMAMATRGIRRVHLLNGRVAVFANAEGPPVRVVGTTWWTDYTLFGTDRRDASMLACRDVMLDYRLIGIEDQPRRKRRFTPADALALHETATAWLAEQLATPFDGKTVVVTHHAPDIGSLDARYAHDLVSAGFVSRRPDLVARADLWVHGHTHTSFDYRLGDARVVCNPRGYIHRQTGAAENAHFDWCKVVEL